MKREEMIVRMIADAPRLVDVAPTDDSGYEFSAIVPGGVIYAVPGMLIDYSGGKWPPNTWINRTEREVRELMRHFLLNDFWTVTPWNQLSDEEIAQWFTGVAD